jgi:hypothetical protein
MVTADDDQPVQLLDAPQLRGALEGLMAIPRCATPSCHEETVLFTDRCRRCLEQGQA